MTKTALENNKPQSPSDQPAHWGRKAGLAVIILLALLLGAGVWVLNDQTRLRSIVESVLSSATDRPFVIDGDFELSLGKQISINATQVRWANASWSATPDMLEAGNFSATVDAWSLLDWPIVITSAHASNVRLLLEWDADNQFNWQFFDASTDEPTQPEALPLLLDEASLENLSVVFRHPALTADLEIVVSDARHKQDELNRLVVQVNALLKGRELNISGRIGPFPELLVAGAVDFDVALTGPHAALDAAGAFTWLAQLQGPNITATLTAPDAADLLNTLQLSPTISGPVDLTVSTETGADAINLSADGQFGRHKLRVELRAKNIRTYEGFDLTMNATGPSMKNVLAIAGFEALPDTPYEFNAAATRSDQGLELRELKFTTTGLDVQGSAIARRLPEIRDLSAHFSARGDNLSTIAKLFDVELAAPLPFEITANIANNGPNTDDSITADIKLGSASARVSGTLTENSGFSGSTLDFDVHAPNGRELAAIVDIELAAGKEFSVSGVAKAGKGKIIFQKLNAAVGANELHGEAALDLGEKLQLDFRGDLSGPNLRDFLRPLLPDDTENFVPSLPYKTSAELRYAAAELVITRSELKLGQSKIGFDGTFQFKKSVVTTEGTIAVSGQNMAELLGGLRLPDIPNTAFEASTAVLLTPDTLRLRDLRFQGARAEISGTLSLSRNDFSSVQFDLKANGANLNQLVPDSSLYQPADVSFQLSTKGLTSDAGVNIDRLNAKIGSAEISLSGSLQTTPTLVANNVRLHAAGPRLEDLGDFAGWQLHAVPFAFSGTLQGSGEQLRVDDIDFTVDESDLRGGFVYKGGERPYVDVDLSSTLLNLDKIRTLDSTDGATGAEVADKQQLFSDDPLPLNFLHEFDGEIDIRLNEFIASNRLFRNAIARAPLLKGDLAVHRITIDSANGDLQASGLLHPTDDGWALEASVQAADAMIVLTDMPPEEVSQLPKHAINLQLTASGASAGEMAASADGYIWIISGEGLVKRLQLGPLAGDFISELLGAINPFVKKSAFTAIDCQGIYFEIIDGTLKTTPAAVIQTDLVIIAAVGSIDLATEKIDFTFETTPRKGIGLSLNDLVSPFTKVTGTLSSPHISLDTQGTVVEGGAAIATGGLTIVAKSLWKRWFGSKQVCEKIAERAREARAKRDPDNVPDLDKMIAGTK